VCAKIADFGLDKFSSSAYVNYRWRAPEILNNRDGCTSKADVYSFGIICWELLTGGKPYKEYETDRTLFIFSAIEKRNLRPTIPTTRFASHPLVK